MANFTHAEYKEFGPNVLKTAPANRVALVKNLAKADNYATFLTKVIADTALNAATDVTFAASGQDLQVTVAAKTGLDPATTAVVGDDLSVAVYNTSSQKIFLCQDATNRAITNETGDTVDIPSLVAFVREYSAAP